MLELVSAESACCLQMRINLSYCLSGTQSTPATLLFSIDHIYGACEPTIYRWWENEEHKRFATGKR